MRCFFSYSKYDTKCIDELGVTVLNAIENFPFEFSTKLVHFMAKHESFANAILTTNELRHYNKPIILAKALEEALYPTAQLIFDTEIYNPKATWKTINEFISESINYCSNYDQTDTIVYFRDDLFPQIKTIREPMVQDEIEEWKSRIASHIDYIENRQQTQEKEKAYLREKQEREEIKPDLSDKTVYTYCGVLMPFSARPYSFRTDDVTIEIGDTVAVSIGPDHQVINGIVVSIGQYLRIAAPYPVEKTKKILHKVEGKTSI